jgi:hypothetical protein
MAEEKQSTKAEQADIVSVKREYFFPEYGMTIEAETLEQAEEVLKERIKQEQSE